LKNFTVPVSAMRQVPFLSARHPHGQHHSIASLREVLAGNS
jgi:hypothetical protein